jgi:hypothetical protein
VSELPNRTASPGYALGQLQQALARAAQPGDAADPGHAPEKVRRWLDVLAGMADGSLAVGSRTPVADTPAWVTLEVAHGGFATGRYLAEAPLTEEEAARLAELPAGIPGATGRERLNLWYLGDAGQSELLEALRSGRYRVEVPEEAALAVAVLLLDLGFPGQALDLVAELRPLMHRLRFAPRIEQSARPSGTLCGWCRWARRPGSCGPRGPRRSWPRCARPSACGIPSTTGSSPCGAPPSRASCRAWARTGRWAAAGPAGSGRRTGRPSGAGGSPTTRKQPGSMSRPAVTPTPKATSAGCAAPCWPAPATVTR